MNTIVVENIVKQTIRTRTIKKTIGGVGVAGCDFNFATATNQTEQVINLGAIIPAGAKIVDCHIRTDAAFTGAVSLATEMGTTSSGHELLGSTDIIAKDTFLRPADFAHQFVGPAATATSIYVASTPGANWSLAVLGKMSVYITYTDVTDL